MKGKNTTLKNNYNVLSQVSFYWKNISYNGGTWIKNNFYSLILNYHMQIITLTRNYFHITVKVATLKWKQGYS